MVWLWTGFFVVVLLLLALDLGVLHRKAEPIGIRAAALWSLGWVLVSLSFNGVIYVLYSRHVFGVGLPDAMHPEGLSGAQAALDFLTAYLVEKSLSVDNIFVMALVFRFFKVPPRFQHRVLFWGILGAIVSRGAMIGVGVWLVQRFDWIFYVFGGLLLFSAVKMLLSRNKEVHPEDSRIVRYARRLVTVSSDFGGGRFITRVDGRFAVTTLFLVLLVIEASDVVFAVDSIPAVFAITTDPFLAMTSNIFAILGLRAMYFMLAGVLDRFRYLDLALTVILGGIGLKMVLHAHVHVSNGWSLGFIAVTLAVGALASLRTDSADSV